jgi:hypothetical protein
MNMAKHLLRKLSLPALLALFVATTVRAQEAAGEIVTTYTLPALAIADIQNTVLPDSVPNDRGLLLGGIGSDLWHGANDAGDEFWMITDRGPNGQISVEDQNRRTFPIPEFTPLILHVQVADGAINIVETIPILNGEGQPVTGLSNLEDHDERPWDYAATTELSFNQDGLDTEGMVRTSSGDFWLVDEYSPSIVHVNAEGEVIRRFVPEGLGYDGASYEVVANLPALLATRRGNRGFEGIALSQDESTIYAAVQSPLRNPDADTGDASRNARIIAFDITTEQVVGEYLYQFEEATVFGADNTPGDMKISGLVAVDADTLLVLERTDPIAHIYQVDLAAATNILGTEWDEPATTPSLEALTDFATSNVTPLPKTLVIDLSTLEGMPAKIEGLALLDTDTLAVANDNDFDIGEFDAEGNNQGSGAVSQILMIDLAQPLA